MAEQQHVALGDAVADLVLPDLAVELVGEQDHHEVAAAGGLDDREHLEALLARLGDRGGVLAQADDDVDAGVLQVERVGVALGAVADDRDGLAVEEREVCVVVVDHWRAGYPTSRRPAAPLARALRRWRRRRACAPGSRARRRRRCRARSAAASAARISAISASGRASTASWKARERSSVVSQNSSKLGCAARQVERLDVDLGEAGLLEQLAHALGVAERERPGRRRGAGRRGEAALDQLARRAAAPTGCARSRPTPPARRARRGAARAGSRRAPRRGRPSACSPSGTARRRRSPPAGRSIRRSAPGTRRWSARARAARARAPSSIASAWSEMITPPVGATSSAASMPVSPSPAASSSTRSPGCGAIASIIQCDTGAPNSRISSWRRTQPERGLFPVLRGSRRDGRSASKLIASSLRSSLPERVRGSGSRRARTAWAPCRARGARRSARAASRPSSTRPGRAHDDRA